MGISFSLKGDFIKKDEVFALQKEVERCHYALHEKTGKGNDFLGWVDLPVNYDKEEFIASRGRRHAYRQTARC